MQKNINHVYKWANMWLSNVNNLVIDFTHEETIKRFENDIKINFLELENYNFNEVIKYAYIVIKKEKIVINAKSNITISTPQNNGYGFEEYVAKIFFKKGYFVETTKKSGDFGADIILSKNNKKIVIQTKFYSSSVGVEAVQQIHAAKGYYNADEAWVITNNKYTAQAFELAKKVNVLLLDGKILEIL